MTEHLLCVADGIDRLIAAIGRAVAWLALAIVLVQFAVVLLRYAFGIGSIWLSESVIYGHATMFMLASAWTLQTGGHVRVDIFYADASPRTKAMVDLAGIAALAAAVRRGAGSGSRCPMWRAPGRCWSARARPADCRSSICSRPIIPLFAVLLGLQGISQAIRAAQVLAASSRTSGPVPGHPSQS